MSIWELVILALGLAMDACAVSVCKGLSVEKPKAKHYFAVGLWFGGFQALMPLLGYLIGSTFSKYIDKYDHWIAFALLIFLGGKMIKEAFSKKEETEEDKKKNSSFGFVNMLVMAIATSIDALTVGVTFALLPEINIFIAIALIGGITFVLSVVGLKIGNLFGAKFKNKAEFVGGLILVLLGLKILLEHLGVINF